MVSYLRRLIRVLWTLLPLAIAFARDKRRFLLFGRSRRHPETHHRDRAKLLRDRMLALGPAFVKVGQVLSTRPDIIPPVYADELATLQNTVPEDLGGNPKDELDEKLTEIFGSDAELTPVAGGSLAYVYQTTYNGDRVAVKVRRPGLKKRIETDLRVVRTLITLAGPFLPERHRFSARNLADDFESVILEELDFEREGRMMRTISENFAADETVYIPRVYQEASTERILTMEFVEGDPVTDREALRTRDIDPEELAAVIAHVYLEMGLEHGTFHADPHPGNLAVDEAGRLVIYDFGMSRHLDRDVQRNLVRLYQGLATRNPDLLVTALIDLDALDDDVDRAAVTDVLSLVIDTLGGGDRRDWNAILMEIVDALREFPFRIPPDVMLLLRVGTVAEGVCRELDPEFDFVAAARAFLIESGEMDTETMLFGDPDIDARETAWSLLRTPTKLERTLDDVNKQQLAFRTRIEGDSLARSVRVLGLAFLAGSFAIATALLAEPFPRYAATGALLTGLTVIAFWLGSRASKFD